MSNHEWESMNEDDFDSMLKTSLSEPLPDDIAREVTPWRHAMDSALVGLAVNAVTVHFLNLNYLLPTIGLILMLLGFRTLRRENGWFKACFVIAIIRAAGFFQSLILNATVLQSATVPSLTALNLALVFLQFFCLWRGFKAVKERAGLPARAGAAVALMVWYLLICLLTLVEYNGTIIGIVLIVSYFYILRNLFHLSKELDEAGYAIQAALVRVPNPIVVLAILAVLGVGMAWGYLFGSSYPMEWTAVGAGEQAEVAEIKAHLAHLGFPEEILWDLTTQDVLACRGALHVTADVLDHPVNDGREVVNHLGNSTHIHTVYDVKELRITGVAVALPGEPEQWKIFHHFLWLLDPGFYGTESLQLWPTCRGGNSGWTQSGDVTGQVLYTLDGQSYTAPYHSLGSQSYTSSSVWGEQTFTDVFATFSLPHGGEGKRGYVSYAVAEMQPGALVDSWINYTHQQSWLQYPVMTAMEQRIANSWSKAGAFFTVQDALQFYPTEEGAQRLG